MYVGLKSFISDNTEKVKSKEGDKIKESGSKSPADKNDRKDKSTSPVSRSSKRRLV